MRRAGGTGAHMRAGTPFVSDTLQWARVLDLQCTATSTAAE